MEGLEKRKSLRLTLPGATLKLSDGTSIKINNISLEGINLQGNLPINSKIEGTLTLSDNKIGDIQVLIVNHQKDCSGGVISNAQDLCSVLTSWFNPKNLISNLMPRDITDNQLYYEDLDHNCRFNFYFNQAKKINKVEIFIYENMILWTGGGWQTGQVNKVDIKPDAQKIKLAKNLIKESQVFPQSFKDWLLDLN